MEHFMEDSSHEELGTEEQFIMPTSSGQKRLWFLNQLEQNSAAYHIASSHKIQGQLNLNALQHAVDELCKRHETLRTTFELEAGQPMQVIHPRPLTQLKIVDATADCLEKTVEMEIALPFDLENGPLLRTLLVRQSAETAVLVLTIHHIISDGWSMGVLHREISELYQYCLLGNHEGLAELPIQYADYAEYQQSWLESDAFEAQKTYWQTQLTPLPPIFRLPAFPKINSKIDKVAPIHLDASLLGQLEKLAQQENATLFMVMMAAWQLLMHRLSNQNEIICGTPLAGRNQPELEGIIGFFLNLLPIYTQFEKEMTFLDLLKNVKQTVLDGFAHQELPFDQLVEQVDVERDVNRHPLFEVMVNFANASTSDLSLINTAVTPIALKEPESKLAITLYIDAQADGINMHLLYRQERFSADQMQAYLNQYAQLLSQIATNSAQSIYSYTLVTTEIEPYLPNPTLPIPLTAYPLVHEALAQVVTDQPDHAAIRQNGQDWSYQQLFDQSRNIAHDLIEQGVQKGDAVAIVGNRSFGLIASMVGVFMSGGVMLSLDRNLPAARQQMMLEIAKAKHVILVGDKRDDEGWIEEVGKITAVQPQSAQVDTNANQIETLPSLDYSDPAYLFFTSGTTGTPKGVLGSHKGLAHFLAWQRSTFNINSNDRSAQLTGLSFDVVLRDIFTPLTGGATLCLPPGDGDLTPSTILPWMQEENITMLHSVPSLAQTWLAHVPEGITLQSLRLIFSAGEPLMDTFIEQWRSKFPQSGQFINIYGPTETTLAKAFYPVPEPPQQGIQPIGTLMPETDGLILNQAGLLCGVGEPGEIVIRTPFRSFGYLNAPEKQTHHFRQNPFTEFADDIVYYTGDLGRYRLDGSLEILGRVDHQIKIRGVRIEPGEIVNVIESHPDVKQTAVLPKLNADNQKYLAAYLVPTLGKTVDINKLRQWLRQRLADAMVPSVFMMMDALPITPNGKLDRKALPEPEKQIIERKRPFVAPTTDIQKRLAAIWESVLNVSPIGIDDDYFDLGGHSLMAVQLFAEIEAELGANLPLATLFQNSTIAHIASLIEAPQDDDLWSSLIEIQSTGEKTPFFCVHGITGDIMWFRELGQLMAPERPFWGIQSQGLDGVKEPFKDIASMATHYIATMKQVQPEGPYIIGGASFGGTVAMEMAQQLTASGEEVAQLIIFDHTPPNTLSDEDNQQTRMETAIGFAKNFPRWFKSFTDLGPAAMMDRVQRKLRVAQKPDPQATQNNNGHSKANMPLDLLEAADIIDYADDLPEHRRQLITANFVAIDTYQPKSWNGRVLLLKAKSRPLFGRSDPIVAWQKLVGNENLTAVEVDGSHEGMFHQPHVQPLSDVIKGSLNTI
ncbi:MAG: amino acid adenylation domain-containing protein [Chloroflexota bacterium]